MNSQFWKNKKVLVTGHTGFKGSWLSLWLQKLDADVIGFSKSIPTKPSLYQLAHVEDGMESIIGDIKNLKEITKIIQKHKPEIIIHMAAQSLVQESYKDPIETYATNIFGTINVMQAIRDLDFVRVLINVTSDKCYENRSLERGYNENDPMGGFDPYSSSKGCAEIVTSSFRNSFFNIKEYEKHRTAIASVRAGNVIGGGDWAADRIIPDCVTAWSTDNLVELRNPHSTRPWQHVLEPLSGYLNLAIDLSQRPELHGEPFNFGPPAQQNHSVLELVQQMALHWDQVRWQDVSNSIEGPYESGLLKLNCDKSLHYLHWHAVMGFEDTVRMTAEWYEAYYRQTGNIATVTQSQIEAYTEIAKLQKLEWAE